MNKNNTFKVKKICDFMLNDEGAVWKKFVNAKKDLLPIQYRIEVMNISNKIREQYNLQFICTYSYKPSLNTTIVSFWDKSYDGKFYDVLNQTHEYIEITEWNRI